MTATMNPHMEGLALVWHSPRADDGPEVEVPLPQGASYMTRADDLRTVVGWELPPGVDPAVLGVAFGAPWADALSRGLALLPDGVQIAAPPPLPDAWARVGLVHALDQAHIGALDPDLLTVDRALAWSAAGHDAPAAAALAEDPELLERLVDDALAGYMPEIAIPLVQAACVLAERLGELMPDADKLADAACPHPSPAAIEVLIEGSQRSPLQGWVLDRLAAAARASGLPQLAAQLPHRGDENQPPGMPLAPTLAELMAVHRNPDTESDGPDQPFDAQTVPLQDVLRAIGNQPSHAERDRVQAALEVYQRLGLTDRAQETEQLLAQLDAQWASEVADLDDLDLAVATWQFEFGMASTAAARGADATPAAGRVVLDSPELFATLMGRARTDIDRWPTLSVATSATDLEVELVLPGEPTSPLVSVQVGIPTTAGTLTVHLAAVSTLELAGRAQLPPDVTPTPGHVDVSEVHHGH